MTYALTTIWYERHRFLPAILAVAFSAVLIAVQCGLVLGLLSMMSLPVDKATADVWVGYPQVRSVDLGRPLPERWIVRLAAQPEIIQSEPMAVGFSLWTAHTGPGRPSTPEVCTVIGSRCHPQALGAVEGLRARPDVLARLNEPRTVVVDESELGRLGINGVGDQADILGKRVVVVGLLSGYKSLGGPYIFCSIDTARELLWYQGDEVSYFLGKCSDPKDAENVVARLSAHTTPAAYRQMTAFTAEQFSVRSRLHWLTTTKAGIAVGFTALLGLLVGAVVTSQTLYAATAASQREFATLRAMGIPRWRLQLMVIAQSFWVGLFGLAVAAPVTVLLAEIADGLGTAVRLHPFIVAGSAFITLGMALGAGLAALRSFQHVDPAHNLR